MYAGKNAGLKAPLSGRAFKPKGQKALTQAPINVKIGGFFVRWSSTNNEL